MYNISNEEQFACICLAFRHNVGLVGCCLQNHLTIAVCLNLETIITCKSNICPYLPHISPYRGSSRSCRPPISSMLAAAYKII